MKREMIPYNVMARASWDHAPRDPVTIFTFATGTLGLGTAAAVAFTVAVTIGVSAVTSWAIQALSPKPDFGALTSAGILVNNRDAVTPQDFVYGEVRKGGAVIYDETTGTNNKYLHRIIALAGHEVEEIGDIYLNDEIVTVDPATNLVNSGPYAGKIRINKHLGDQTTADADLLNESENEEIDSNFVGYDIAYIYCRFEYDRDVFANGLPLVTAKVKGKKVYDPRTDTTGYSNNAALCLRDYLTANYGLNDDDIDETAFQIAANECDENVALSEGGTEKKYTLNGVVRANQKFGEVIQQMTTACAGTLFWGMGAWDLVAGAYSAPVEDFTLDDLRGPISVDPLTNLRDAFNTVNGTFNDANQDYITVDYPSVTSETFVNEDGGEALPLDLQLPYTTSAATAQRLAKLTLYRAREQIGVTANFSLKAFNVEVGDIITFTNERYGWDQKQFEVVGWNLNVDESAGLSVRLDLRETSEAAFDWNAEETEIIANNTNLPDFLTVATITNLQLTATSVLNDDGISIPAIRATWTPSIDAFVDYYEIQYKRLGGEEDYGTIAETYSDQEDWGSIAEVFTGQEDYGLTNEPILSPDGEYISSFGNSPAFLIQPVLNGYDYIVRVRAVNSLGVRSPWVSNSLASIGDTTPPNTPLSLSAVAGYKAITLSWINPADQDLDFVEIWQSETNNLATATQVGVVRGSNFTVPDLPNNATRYYWVRAVDYSLNKSEFSDGASATTLLIQPNDFSDAVNDLFQEAGAFGVEPVSSLPASGDFDGQLVLLLPEITIYRWDEATSQWSTDIFTASSVEAGSITYASFASGIEPVGVVDALPTVTGYDGPQVVVLTTDGKLYRLVDDEWTAAVSTDDIEGQIGENLFSDDLRPIERVNSLPTTSLTQGRVVLLTTDNKLYRYTGNAWTTAVPTTDLTGQITGTQITDNAVTTTKIAANAVTANSIASNSITSSKIQSAAISADKLAANSVTASAIASDAITADAIAANSIGTDALIANSIIGAKIATGAISADQIASGAITTSKLFAGSVDTNALGASVVTANKVAAGAIITSKIATGAVTADKISVSELSAITADLGTIQVDTANIADGAISSAKIDDLQVSTLKIAENAISATSAATANNSVTSAITVPSFSSSQPVLVLASFARNGQFTGQHVIKRNGTTIKAVFIGDASGAIVIIDTPGAGTHSYTYTQSNTGVTVPLSITLQLIKR